MKPNTVKGSELFVRCPNCKDSRDVHHAHMTINLSTGLYHCYLCKIGGKVNPTLLFQLQLSDFPAMDYGTGNIMPDVIRGPGSNRPSLLERYHSNLGHDVFMSWWKDAPVGYYFKGTDGSKKLWGFSGIAWANSPKPYLSTPDNPLRFVEGPYDVLHSQDVCFFGIPHYSKVKQFFAEHYFVLAPDGDIWTNQFRFAIMKTLMDRLIREGFGFLGVEFLPKNNDPDDILTGSSRFIPVQFFKERLWKSISVSSRAQQSLESLR